MSTTEKQEIKTKFPGKLESIWKKCNSPLVLLVLGFLLTAIAGGVVNDVFQKSSWERERKFSIRTYDLERANAFLEHLTELMYMRFFISRRLVYRVSDLSKEEYNKLFEQEYLPSFNEWNKYLYVNESKLERLTNEETVKLLTIKIPPYLPRSIDGRFTEVNQNLKKLREWINGDSLKFYGDTIKPKEKEDSIKRFKANLDTLDTKIHDLIDTLIARIKKIEDKRLNDNESE